MIFVQNLKLFLLISFSLFTLSWELSNWILISANSSEQLVKLDLNIVIYLVANYNLRAFLSCVELHLLFSILLHLVFQPFQPFIKLLYNLRCWRIFVLLIDLSVFNYIYLGFLNSLVHSDYLTVYFLYCLLCTL